MTMSRYVVGSLLLVLFIPATATDGVEVYTRYGLIRGVKNSQAVSFLGIPYAKPPINELRWQPPQDVLPWRPSVLNATQLQPGCPQHGCLQTNPAMVCPKSTAESCLFMNIYRPLYANMTSALPVMVYIHGGNFVHMSSTSPIFRGDAFVAMADVILVTFDYRLGVLGFLYTGTRPEDAKGNYGIQDQILALRWVQENILNFGGDPNKVTLFGQSAGAQSTVIQLMQKDSEQLFRNVIIESSPFDIPLKSPLEALYLASTIKKALNCTEVEYMGCLRSKTADEIAEAQLKSRSKPTSLKILEFFEPLGPFVDGDIIPVELIDGIQNNLIRRTPTMIGTVSEETRVFVYSAWGKPLLVEEYLAVLAGTYPSKVKEMINMYPPSSSSVDNRDVLSALGTDFIFTCATRNMSQNIAKTEISTFNYIFDHSFSFNGWGNFTFCEGHVCHGEEIAFVFHSADQSGFNFSQEEEFLSDSMIRYWANFAYTSNPNLGPHKVNLPWPTYSESNPVSMLFQTPKNSIISTYQDKFCDFWDAIGYSA